MLRADAEGTLEGAAKSLGKVGEEHGSGSVASQEGAGGLFADAAGQRHGGAAWAPTQACWPEHLCTCLHASHERPLSIGEFIHAITSPGPDGFTKSQMRSAANMLAWRRKRASVGIRALSLWFRFLLSRTRCSTDTDQGSVAQPQSWPTAP
jgi:hypothetical protein